MAEVGVRVVVQLTRGEGDSVVGPRGGEGDVVGRVVVLAECDE